MCKAAGLKNIPATSIWFDHSVLSLTCKSLNQLKECRTMQSPSDPQDSGGQAARASAPAGGAIQDLAAETKSVTDRVSPRIEDSLRAMRFTWEGRPLDFFALALLVMGAQSATFSVLDAFAGRGSLPTGVILARHAPMLLLIVIVALLAAFRTNCLTVAPTSPRRRGRTR